MNKLTTHIKPPDLKKLMSLRKPPRNMNEVVDESLSKLDRLAIAVTERVGTMGFFFTIFVWTVIWLGWNLLAPRRYQFDPPNSFVFWLFISNLIQIFLMPLIMVGQNQQSRRAEFRAENDYQVNLKAEREIEAILVHLDYQNTLLCAIASKVGLEVEHQDTPKPEG